MCFGLFKPCLVAVIKCAVYMYVVCFIDDTLDCSITKEIVVEILTPSGQGSTKKDQTKQSQSTGEERHTEHIYHTTYTHAH